MAKLKHGRVRKRTRAKPSARGAGDRALHSLDVLAAALPSAEHRAGGAAAPDPHRASARTGMHSSAALSKIRQRESRRHEQIRSHPAFVEDPLAAITAHLAQTLPAERARPAPQSARARRGRAKRPGA